MNRTRTFLGLTVLLLSSTACGAPDDDAELEDVEATAEAFGESSCLTAGTNVTIVPGGSLSPTTYSNANCSKTWIFERPGISPSPTGAYIHWTDPWSRTEVQCTGGRLRVQVQSRAGTTGAWRNDGSFSLPLLWDPSAGLCMYPSAQLEENSQSHVPLGSLVYYNVPEANPHSPPPTDQERILLPGSILGRHARYAVQALTPRGSTQSVEVH